jgi:hypothetical protein
LQPHLGFELTEKDLAATCERILKALDEKKSEDFIFYELAAEWVLDEL